jgi:hypothetical protein
MCERAREKDDGEREGGIEKEGKRASERSKGERAEGKRKEETGQWGEKAA